MTSKQAKLIRLAMKLIALGIMDPSSFSFPEVIKARDRLRRKLISIFVENELDETLEEVEEALRNATQTLASAHQAAAAITVSAPTDSEVANFTKHLDALNDDIKNDQRFRATVNLIASLQETIPALDPSG